MCECVFSQGVVGSERSLKTAVVSLFVEGVMELDGDEKGMLMRILSIM